MINELSTVHNPRILEIINKAAQVYKGVIPDDRWKEPYMSKEELKKEIEEGVKFMGYKENTTILGVMGIQQVKDTTFIRHAYITPKYQKKGIGKKILKQLIIYYNMKEFNPNTVKKILEDMISYGLVDAYNMPIDDERYLLDIYNVINNSTHNGIKVKYDLYFVKELINN